MSKIFKRAWRHGRIIETRRAGFVYIVMCVVLGVVSVNSGNNLLYLLTAMLLAYMLASGLAGRGNIRAASVSLSLPGEIYASIPCAVSVTVSNKNRFTPIFLIETALEQENGGLANALFPAVQPGTSQTRALFTAFPVRGRRFFKDVRLSSVYPFNFFTRYWPVEDNPEAIVFPCPLACDMESALVPADDEEREGDAKHETGPLSDTDIVGVRPYVEGDSMKRVHWKSSARTGKLKTRIYDGDSSRARQRRVIDLNRLVAGGVERGLSMAAYVVSESMKSGLSVGMKIGAELIPPEPDIAHKKYLLTRLALYEERGGYGRRIW